MKYENTKNLIKNTQFVSTEQMVIGAAARDESTAEVHAF